MYEVLSLSLLIAILTALLVFVAPKTATPRLVLTFLCLTIVSSSLAWLAVLIANGTLSFRAVLEWAAVAAIFGSVFSLWLIYEKRAQKLRSTQVDRAWAAEAYRKYDERVSREQRSNAEGTEMEPRTPT